MSRAAAGLNRLCENYKETVQVMAVHDPPLMSLSIHNDSSLSLLEVVVATTICSHLQMLSIWCLEQHIETNVKCMSK